MNNFWPRVEKDGPLPACDPSLGKCWEWVGQRTRKGYGRIQTNNRLLLAHRYSYELNVGKIPEDLEIDHLCRNRICVNPAHLEAVTQIENFKRSIPYRTKHGRCKRGHLLSGANLYIGTGGRRVCKACNRMKSRESAARIRARNYTQGLTWDGFSRKQLGLERARELRKDAKAGRSQKQLRAKYGLNAKQIRNIIKGVCWPEPA